MDLIRKLLAMKIKVTTVDMLAVCHTHIAIADNMSLMFLSTKAVNAVQTTIKDDPLLSALADTIITGWPDDIKDVQKAM